MSVFDYFARFMQMCDVIVLRAPSDKHPYGKLSFYRRSLISEKYYAVSLLVPND